MAAAALDAFRTSYAAGAPPTLQEAERTVALKSGATLAFAAPTGFTDASGTPYTCHEVAFFLMHGTKGQAGYIKECTQGKVKRVAFIDQRVLLAYLKVRRWRAGGSKRRYADPGDGARARWAGKIAQCATAR